MLEGVLCWETLGLEDGTRFEELSWGVCSFDRKRNPPQNLGNCQHDTAVTLLPPVSNTLIKGPLEGQIRDGGSRAPVTTQSRRMQPLENLFLQEKRPLDTKAQLRNGKGTCHFQSLGDTSHEPLVFVCTAQPGLCLPWTTKGRAL